MAEEMDVTGDSSAPEGVVEGSPPSEGVGDGSPPSQEATTPQEEVLPFGKHPRWIKQVEANRALKSELAKRDEKMRELEGQAATARWVKEDPKGFLAYLQSQVGAEKPENDPYEAFEPEVAERFRRYDKALEDAAKEKQEYQNRQAQTTEQRIESNKGELDDYFDQLAKESNLVDATGKADEELMDVIANAVLAKMHGTARDPKMPTKQELKNSFDSVMKGLKKAGKSFTPKPVPIPASGSNRGTIPAGKTKMSEDERIASIVADLG